MLEVLLLASVGGFVVRMSEDVVIIVPIPGPGILLL